MNTSSVRKQERGMAMESAPLEDPRVPPKTHTQEKALNAHKEVLELLFFVNYAIVVRSGV